MSLEQQLKAKKEELEGQMSDKAKEVSARAVKDLAESGIIEKSLKKGDKAPDFALPDAQGNVVELKNLLKRGPVVVNFYRGGW